MENKKQFWIIKVNDGENFRNSKYPFWGVVRGRCGSQKTNVKKIKKGDILWFLTSKKYGAKIIGMSEYCEFYDRNDEPLIQINTYSNKEQGWEGNDDWSLQMHYTKLYDTEKQDIKVVITGPQSIIKYNPDHKNQINIDNLYKHYNGFTFYGVSKY